MNNRGFIALISAIIMSVVLMVVIVGGNLIGIYARFNVFDREMKQRSRAAADACIETLRYRIAVGTTLDAPVSLGGGDMCDIVTASDPFEVRGVFNGATTNVYVSIDADSYLVKSYEEVARF